MAVPMNVDASAMGEEGRSAPEFTDEEKSGKYLDLNEVHRQYINLRFAEKVRPVNNIYAVPCAATLSCPTEFCGALLCNYDCLRWLRKQAGRLTEHVWVRFGWWKKCSYLEFLDTFQRPMDIPQAEKQGMYRTYLTALLQYLVSFYRRSEPLYNLDADLTQAASASEAEYNAGTFAGWTKDDNGVADDAAAVEPVDVVGFASAAELEGVGLEVLKASLTALGLKCGGNLEQRAERLFSTKGKERSAWDKSILAGKPKGGGKDGKKKRQKPTGAAAALPVVAMEAKVFRLADLMADTIQLTREDVQRRQSQTAAERAAEDEDVAVEEPADGMEEEDDAAYDSDNELIYNPKGLPLDPVTGKPIPYWLYKLHGLNNIYKCEICGDQSYKGPKASASSCSLATAGVT
jgi:splicing factor 3A subunit 3